MRVRAPSSVGGLVILLLVVALLGVAGTAAAYWTGLATGSGSAGTGPGQPVVLSPATAAAGLYPGSRADVALTVTNPNPAQVVLTSIRLDGARSDGGLVVDAGHAGCATSVLSFTSQTNGGSGWRVSGATGAGDGRLSVTLPNALAMAIDAPNACQGATVTVYLAVGP